MLRLSREAGNVTDHIRHASADGVFEITLARPEKLNALSETMYRAMADALERAEADAGIRAVAFLADGAAFTAGNDLSDFARYAQTGEVPVEVLRFVRALARARKPLVAAVQGRAVGIGTTMLLHCDHVLMAPDAVLSVPFVGLGLVPEAASSLLLPERIGHVRAHAMFALGETLDAEQAVAFGIANRLVSRDQLHETARAVCRKFAALPPEALADSKRLMRDGQRIAQKIEAEAAVFVERLRSAEARAAFRAFAERGLSGKGE